MASLERDGYGRALDTTSYLVYRSQDKGLCPIELRSSRQLSQNAYIYKWVIHLAGPYMSLFPEVPLLLELVAFSQAEW